jgi:transcriptional regulator with XRE-family HTH domain
MINQKLRRARIRKCWTIGKAAEEAKVSIKTYQRWELGTQVPHLSSLQLLSQAFEMLPDELGFADATEEELREGLQGARDIALQPTQSTDSIIVLTEGQARSLLVLLGEDNMGDFDAARRELLRQLATIVGTTFVAPMAAASFEPWQRLSHAISKPYDIDQATLAHFVRITEGCWHITNGSEMAVVGQVLPTFLPKLASLTHQSSKNLPTIAELTAQGYLLAGLVALDQFNLPAMDVYSQLAVQHGQQYSELSHDYNLLAAALKQQATMYLIAKNPSQALATYEKTLPFIHQVSPLLRSRIYQGLAGACARCGHEQEALRYIGNAQETFPDRFEEDPSFLYADSGLSVLFMYDGLMHLDLGQPELAWNAFSNVIDGESLQPKITIGELTHLEFINLLAKTAVASHDQERSRTYIEAAVSRSKVLNSQWGRSEAWDVYQTMRIVWPSDTKVRTLAEHFRK